MAEKRAQKPRVVDPAAEGIKSTERGKSLAAAGITPAAIRARYNMRKAPPSCFDSSTDALMRSLGVSTMYRRGIEDLTRSLGLPLPTPLLGEKRKIEVENWTKAQQTLAAAEKKEAEKKG